MNCITLFSVALMILIIGEVSARRKAKWRVGIKASVGSGGRRQISGSIGVSWRRKRDIQSGVRNTFKMNPCLLKSYDINEDDEITVDEIQSIFQNSPVAEGFFEDGDINRDDKISEDEFSALVSRIEGCSVDSYDSANST